MFRKLTTKEMLRNEELRSKQREIMLTQENQNLGVEVSEREINEIEQGQQISELEIKVLELMLSE